MATNRHKFAAFAQHTSILHLCVRWYVCAKYQISDRYFYRKYYDLLMFCPTRQCPHFGSVYIVFRQMATLVPRIATNAQHTSFLQVWKNIIKKLFDSHAVNLFRRIPVTSFHTGENLYAVHAWRFMSSRCSVT